MSAQNEDPINEEVPLTLTELLASIYVVEYAKFEADPQWQAAWELAEPHQRAFTMGAMVEVVRQLGLLGVHVSLSSDESGLQISVRAVNPSPRQFGVISNIGDGATVMAMAASHPESTPSRVRKTRASLGKDVERRAAMHLRVHEATQLGYTGNLCEKCGSSQMVRSGACEKCENCGESSGCS